MVHIFIRCFVEYEMLRMHLLTSLFRSQHLGQSRDQAVAGDDRQAAPGRRGVAQVTTITLSSFHVRCSGRKGFVLVSRHLEIFDHTKKNGNFKVHGR